ncbi:MAG: chorismate mutase [Alphaproteobacteria bacterium]
MSEDNKEKLKQYRDSIDKIDDEIHQLLMTRTKFTQKIADAKGKTTGLAIRPNREAEIHRRLFKNHDNVFPYTSLARIWREMVNAFTLMQANYSVCVYVDGDDTRCWELARDQFGSIVNIERKNNIDEVIGLAENDNTVIAVIPTDKICKLDKTKVMLRLPFAGKRQTLGDNYDAFAIGQLDLIATDKDKTVMIGNELPQGAEQIAKVNDDIFYIVDGFKTGENVIGSYPDGVESD